MEIFGIGPLEFVLIVVIMLIILGPKEMMATAGKIGRFVRQVVRSPMWGQIMQTSKEVRDLPAKIIQEAGLEEEIKQIKEVAQTPGQMMSDAARQLKVEMPSIELPKVQNPLSTPAATISAASLTSSAPTPTAPASNNPPAPLQIEPVAPEAYAPPPVPADPNIPVTIEPLLTTSDEIPPLTESDGSDETPVFEPPPSPDDRFLENPPTPLIVEDASPEIPTGAEAQPVAAPKRRGRPPKAKPLPLETEPITAAETPLPHDNGNSASNN